MQAHTSQPGLEPTQAYSLWSPVAPAIAAWAPWIVYASGDVVSYNGVDYEVRLPHMSLPGWVPPVVASLWSAVPPPDGSAWAPQTPYGVGDTAVYDGIMYVVLQAHTSQLDWTPPVVAALWSAMQ